jgi:hypothetical protein
MARSLSDKITVRQLRGLSSGRTSSGPDPLNAPDLASIRRRRRSACNYVKLMQCPDFDKLIDEAGTRRNATRPSRAICCGRRTTCVQDDAPVWFFNYNKAVMAYQPWVHGLTSRTVRNWRSKPYDDIWIDETAPVIAPVTKLHGERDRSLRLPPASHGRRPVYRAARTEPLMLALYRPPHRCR